MEIGVVVEKTWLKEDQRKNWDFWKVLGAYL
jgi:hypothetical protein